MINLKNILKVKKKYDEKFTTVPYRPKLTIFSGAGISKESGLSTFRDSDGLWNNFDIKDIATAHAVKNNLSGVLDFYNERRREMLSSNPNLAHIISKELEEYYEVVIVTQNVDNLHEKAGSSNVLHLHGEITKSRPICNTKIIYDQVDDIKLGDRCKKTNSQLRPNIVLFGENLNSDIYYDARRHIRESDILIVTGTSLEVEPAASLIAEGFSTRKFYLIDPNDVKVKYSSNYEHIKMTSSEGLSHIKSFLISESDKIIGEKS